jgi:PAS domain S-box-containing protein
MIENLSQSQIAAIFESLPIDITFIDEKDDVKFWNKHESRMFKRPIEALNKDVRECHSSKSVDKVDKLIADFKRGGNKPLEYQIRMKGRIFNIINTPVRDKKGKYLGTIEIDQDITDLIKNQE